MTTPDKPTDLDQLTEHFHLREFVSSSDPRPSETVLANIRILAEALEAYRQVWGRPIIITSGYRTPAHNRQVGGAGRSFHMQGLAADIEVPGWPPGLVQVKLRHWLGGMGRYATHTHVDCRGYIARW